ncbi:MAG TPA: nicotinate phosphoribosyltransferase [Chromatiaceae bacterium]|jgi:nicotinamide phosphoribosyltransferase|nr:MAG: nicotinate phosphoribosyltransferase [Thiohalocapsa sp. PB-PSB1]QQO53768.1 MAG: nicotinate phosphoribosyltransferase [Thiohalocapsa sp. PB-PSB1]HBG96579.1 nicotinate phosphoribosyltransferase [Chromatiaceae bacterium]HCS91637.1 nicotinate phosphoribosyltransferase [Chromatiaceae bacterium]
MHNDFDAIRSNFILNTDSYKESHHLQFPPDTEAIQGYVESRGGRFPSTLFFGLQMFVQEYLTRPITSAMIDQAEAFYDLHMPGSVFNRAGWEYIVAEHGGLLPIRIRAVAEGSVLPVRNVLATVESTDPRVPWISQYAETALLRAIWYPTTVATQSWYIKAMLRQALERTAESSDGLAFMMHDFGARGVSSLESAALGGAAHLVAFMGSDTVAGVVAANHYYDADMAAFSIPAAEHSTITAWGEAHELDAYRNMLNQFARPGGLVAVVSDSYDLERAVGYWGRELRAQVLASGATIVVRPDSGHPPTIVRRTLEQLAAAYGTQTNAKGYRVLNQVRVIQGDGIDYDSIAAILAETEAAGFSAENLAFGAGGTLLQRLHRDTQRFALKACAIRRQGTWQDIQKNPRTDPEKASKGGRQALLRHAQTGNWRTQREEQPIPDGWQPALEPVFEDGRILRRETLDAIRARADVALERARVSIMPSS